LLSTDDVTMTCGDIKERVKQFLDDLLAEDEYQQFIKHCECCAGCRDHVTSLGSISNQVWKLGDVAVPPDLDSAALFKLQQLEEGIRLPKAAVTKRDVVIAALSMIMVLAAVAGLSYFKNRGRSRGPAATIQKTAHGRDAHAKDLGR